MSTQATLDSQFAGELISPDHPRYHEARKLFNGMISLNQNIPPSNGA